jgi:hypothetical protein
MPVSIRNTDILFNDGTTMSSAVHSLGAVNSYAFMSRSDYNGVTNTGATVSGSNLRFRAAQAGGGRWGSGNYVTTNPNTATAYIPGGTWRLMGYINGTYEYYGTVSNHTNTCSLWQRIA